MKGLPNGALFVTERLIPTMSEERTKRNIMRDNMEERLKWSGYFIPSHADDECQLQTTLDKCGNANFAKNCQQHPQTAPRNRGFHRGFYFVATATTSKAQTFLTRRTATGCISSGERWTAISVQSGNTNELTRNNSNFNVNSAFGLVYIDVMG